MPTYSVRWRAVREFFIALGALALFRVALGFLGVPLALVIPLTLVVTALFISIPAFALFKAASAHWTAKLSVLFLLIGLVVQFGLYFLVKGGFFGTGLIALVASSLSQQGLLIWCAGLGGLLACLIKDKNLLIPISIFLAGFDVFLVLTPIGPTQQILQKAPEILPAIGMNLPKVQSTPTMGPVEAFAFIGPADFLFIAMFFIALFKFEMRTRETLRALVPAILVYLALALVFPSVPLLVPIGLTVLAVNFRCFNLSRDEWASTGVIAVIVIGAIAYGATRPKLPPAPLPQEGDQAPARLEGSPPPKSRDSRR